MKRTCPQCGVVITSDMYRTCPEAVGGGWRCGAKLPSITAIRAQRKAAAAKRNTIDVQMLRAAANIIKHERQRRLSGTLVKKWETKLKALRKKRDAQMAQRTSGVAAHHTRMIELED